MAIKYTKAMYQAKITELDGYYAQLEQHLGRMEELKSQMFEFWDDPNARDAGTVLTTEIRQVRNSMTRTSDLLTFYRSSVDKLDGVGGIVTGLLEDALLILSGAGI